MSPRAPAGASKRGRAGVATTKPAPSAAVLGVVASGQDAVPGPGDAPSSPAGRDSVFPSAVPLAGPGPGPGAPGGSTGHLLALLAVLEMQVRRAVGVRREIDDDPDDAFRGLYLDDDDVDRLLAGGWPPLESPGDRLVAARQAIAAAAERRAGEAGPSRLSEMASRFGLDSLDIDLLLVAVAPDLDSRFERLYGYLNDDVTLRRATIGLALELCGQPPTSGVGRQRLEAGAPLLAGGLLVVDEVERPFLTRSLRVPDRVSAHLLGDDRPAPELAPLLVPAPPPVELDPRPLARALEAGSGFAYLRERPGTAGRSLAAQALAARGLAALHLDLSRLDPDADAAALARSAGREARLLGAGVVAGPLESLAGTGDGSARERSLVRAFAELAVEVVLLGRVGWDPSWSIRVPLVVHAPLVTPAARLGSWLASLDGERVATGAIEEATGTFRLGPEQAQRGALAARLHAAYSGSPLRREDLVAGARSQNAAGLEKMAHRIEPAVGFDDLVLPAGTLRLLHELVSRVRYRDVVLGEWQMRPGGGRGRGVTALFAGDSGTGKTMSAEVVAGALGLELYTINLATVVDKYIGETEKNLERIFSEVDGVNGVLLFDEADALFGKRSEVRDAHDRYANIEVAYLLQRIETFDGLAILATNLRANVDDAFTRRLDSLVDFPFPDVEQRRQLWERSLGAKVPLADDVELDFLAASFELSGGNISSIALTAGYLAAERGGEVTMADLVRAVHREYRKLGRLSVRSEFGQWHDAIADEG